MWAPSLLLLALAATASAQSDERWLYKVGHASDLKTGKPLYSEHHRERFVDGKLRARDVEYRCPNGKRFGEKTLSLTVGYVPDFITSDFRSGYQEGVRTVGTRREVFFKRDAAAAEQSKPLPAVLYLVADAGFDLLIGERFEDLRKGQKLTINFLVPSRLATIEFRLLRIPHKKQDLQGSVRFQLAPNSALFRLLVDPLEVSYGNRTRRLKSFEGLTNLRDDDGKNYSARIVFRKREQISADQPNNFPAKASEALQINQTCESS